MLTYCGRWSVRRTSTLERVEFGDLFAQSTLSDVRASEARGARGLGDVAGALLGALGG
jgi:hypothetical protein